MFQGKALRNVIIAGILLLVGLIGFLAYNNQQVDKEREEAEKKVADITSLLAQKEEEMIELEVLFEDREEQIDVRNKLLKQKRIELANFKQQIEELKRSKLVDQRTIAQLEEKVAQMEAQLVELEQEELNFLVAKVQVQQNVIDSISVDASNLRKENQEMRQELGLAVEPDPVDNGSPNSIPDAENFAFYDLSQGAKKQIVDIPSDQVKSMEICFTLLSNINVPIKDYDLYMEYVDADGFVLTLASGSGDFILDGNRRLYTAKKTVHYDGDRQDVCIPITFDEKVPKGRHRVNIYCNEILIGWGDFSVS